jgi:hypothetical protein
MAEDKHMPDAKQPRHYDDRELRMTDEFFLPRVLAAGRERLPETPAADREAGPGVYQVWHDAGWPQRAGLNVRFGVETPFPQGFLHVADVEADSLGQAVALTGGAGYLPGPDGGLSWEPWETNPGVRAWALLSQTRDTERGDVIVDPRGNAHRYDGRGFRAIEAASGERMVADPVVSDATIGISRDTLKIAADEAFPEPPPSLTAAILDNPKSFLPDSGPGTDHDHGPDRGR